MQGNAGNRFQSSQYTIKYIGGKKPGLCHPDQFCVTYVYTLFTTRWLKTSLLATSSSKSMSMALPATRGLEASLRHFGKAA